VEPCAGELTLQTRSTHARVPLRAEPVAQPVHTPTAIWAQPSMYLAGSLALHAAALLAVSWLVDICSPPSPRLPVLTESDFTPQRVVLYEAEEEPVANEPPAIVEPIPRLDLSPLLERIAEQSAQESGALIQDVAAEATPSLPEHPFETNHSPAEVSTDADWSRVQPRVKGTGGSSEPDGVAPNGTLGGGENGDGDGGLIGFGGSASAGGGRGSGSGTGGGRGTGEGAGAQVGSGGAGNGDGTRGGGGRKAKAVRTNGGPYPASARRARHEGTVVVRVEVLTDGHVGKVELAQSSGFDDLDQAAVTAARDWRFEPATDGGHAVVSWMDVRYRYVLE